MSLSRLPDRELPVPCNVDVMRDFYDVAHHHVKGMASFSSSWISADKAVAWGLLVDVVEPDALMDAARELAEGIIANDQKTVAHFKHVLQDGLRLPFGEGLTMERQEALAFYGSMDMAGVTGGWQSKL